MSAFRKTIESLERGMESGLHLGAQMCVIRDGETVLDIALGENDSGQPLTTRHLMPWLSCGKPITALAILQLVERGQLTLDAPIADVIPEFAQAGKDSITVRHVLTHTGGIRDGDKISEHLAWDETIERICGVALEPGWEPGRKAGYHIRGSWFILGELIRRIDGRPVKDMVREDIFEPVNMTDSWLALSSSVLAVEHERIGLLHLTHDRTPVLHPFLNRDRTWLNACPGSSLRGPVSDLAKFYDHLHSTAAGHVEGVLSQNMVREMTARQRNGLFDTTFNHIMDWGFGVIINSARHGRGSVPYGYGLHAGEATFGHGGMQSSSAFADPENNLAVAWVCNGMPGEPKHQLRSRELNTLIYEDLGLSS